ncbi:hypothetical protein LY78DRAFT_738723 [Colletotrichum sublineola]|nr:hypothetical protein LY78DRAFT_738723 [Colletotrichum sublineola]
MQLANGLSGQVVALSLVGWLTGRFLGAVCAVRDRGDASSVWRGRERRFGDSKQKAAGNYALAPMLREQKSIVVKARLEEQESDTLYEVGPAFLPSGPFLWLRRKQSTWTVLQPTAIPVPAPRKSTPKRPLHKKFATQHTA